MLRITTLVARVNGFSHRHVTDIKNCKYVAPSLFNAFSEFSKLVMETSIEAEGTEE